jgi:hypothetical protein
MEKEEPDLFEEEDVRQLKNLMDGLYSPPKSTISQYLTQILS